MQRKDLELELEVATCGKQVHDGTVNCLNFTVRAAWKLRELSRDADRSDPYDKASECILRFAVRMQRVGVHVRSNK